MGEEDVIRRSTKGPVTTASLVSDLQDLGLAPGSVVLVHSSLSSMGWVCGGAVSVILALEEVMRPYGTIMMPTHSGDLSDPSGWNNPPVPQSWWESIRKSMPPYDPELTPTRGMGVVAETFRSQANVVRSRHPQLSFAAWGEQSIFLLQNHSFEFGLGEGSPLARLYDNDGWVLLIGVDHSVNTSLHLAEIRARYPGRKTIECSSPVHVDGHTRWKRYRELNYESTDFASLGEDFVDDNKQSVRIGKVGYAQAQLFRQRLCVDFAVHWFERKRR